MEIKELEINLGDASAKEFADDLLGQLLEYRAYMSAEAMNCCAVSFHQGRMAMLDEVIVYLESVRP